MIAARRGTGTHAVTIGGLPASATRAIVYTENRTVAVAGGSLADTFGRWGVHVYRLDVTPPAPAPTVSGFSPASGPVGSSVTITGANFTGVTSVQLGTSTSGFVNASYTVGSSTSITATVPGGKPSGRWRVTTSGGSATSAGTFTVTATAAPTVTGFSPTSGPVGSTVTITGTNFTGATAVAIGTSTTGFVNATTFTVVSPTRIDVLVPSGRTAPGHWRVTTPGGRGISSTQFTIT